MHLYVLKTSQIKFQRNLTKTKDKHFSINCSINLHLKRRTSSTIFTPKLKLCSTEKNAISNPTALMVLNSFYFLLPRLNLTLYFCSLINQPLSSPKAQMVLNSECSFSLYQQFGKLMLQYENITVTLLNSLKVQNTTWQREEY